MADKGSYRFTISIPDNPANADLIDKLQRMENGARSRFTRALMEDGFKFRDDAGIERYYGVFFRDEAPSEAPAPKTKIKPAEDGEKAKKPQKRASGGQTKAPAAKGGDFLDKALDDTILG